MTGNYRTSIESLPEVMSTTWRLRQLHVCNVMIRETCDVLTELTALESLVILRDSNLRSDDDVEPQNPLPAGMSALRSLQELRATLYAWPMPLLALPALELLQIDNALTSNREIRPA